MLPQVKKEILDSLQVSMGNLEQSREYLKEKMTKIKDENPILFHLLITMANRDEWTDKEKNCYILGACQFYILLSMQDESDELSEMFPL